MSEFAVIMPAGGRSNRFGHRHYKKPFAPLDNRAVWLHSAERFLNRDDVKQLIVVVAEDDLQPFHDKFGANVAILGVEVVVGGAERVDSVAAGLAQVREDLPFVAIHDAARPCLAEEWIDGVFEAAVKSGAATLAIPVHSTLKRVVNGQIVETVPRDGIWASQTPQVARRDWLVEAFANRGELQPTDEAQLLEQAGRKVAVVEGSPINIKITTQADLRLASHLLKAMPKPKTMGGLNPFADDDHWR